MENIEERHRISEEIENFLVDRRGRKLSHTTINFYKEKLSVFENMLKEDGIIYVEDINARLLRELFSQLGRSHNSGGVLTFFKSIRTFLNWFEEDTDAQISNPIRKVHGPRVNSTPIPRIPMRDIQLMIETCGKSITDIRDQAAIHFLVDTGVRSAEFLNMHILDVDMNSGTVKVIKGKGNKDRTVFIGPTTRSDVMRYLRRRRSKDPRDYLWVTQNGSQLTYEGLRQILQRHAKLAGITYPSPHDFRRTFAIECLRNGMDLIQLMYLMGHTTTVVLQRYLAIQDDNLRNAHLKNGPIEQNRR